MCLSSGCINSLASGLDELSGFDNPSGLGALQPEADEDQSQDHQAASGKHDVFEGLGGQRDDLIGELGDVHQDLGGELVDSVEGAEDEDACTKSQKAFDPERSPKLTEEDVSTRPDMRVNPVQVVHHEGGHDPNGSREGGDVVDGAFG